MFTSECSIFFCIFILFIRNYKNSASRVSALDQAPRNHKISFFSPHFLRIPPASSTCLRLETFQEHDRRRKSALQTLSCCMAWHTRGCSNDRLFPRSRTHFLDRILLLRLYFCSSPVLSATASDQLQIHNNAARLELQSSFQAQTACYRNIDTLALWVLWLPDGHRNKNGKTDCSESGSQGSSAQLEIAAGFLW